MNKLILSAVAIVSATACASSAREYEMSEDAAATLAKFERTGDMRSCLSPTAIDSITAIDDHNLLIRSGVSKYYLNETKGRCSGASRAGNRIQYTVRGGQICRNQIISVVDNSSGIPAGSCSLGDFELLEKKTEQPEE